MRRPAAAMARCVLPMPLSPEASTRKGGPSPSAHVSVARKASRREGVTARLKVAKVASAWSVGPMPLSRQSVARFSSGSPAQAGHGKARPKSGCPNSRRRRTKPAASHVGQYGRAVVVGSLGGDGGPLGVNVSVTGLVAFAAGWLRPSAVRLTACWSASPRRFMGRSLVLNTIHIVFSRRDSAALARGGARSDLFCICICICICIWGGSTELVCGVARNVRAPFPETFHPFGDVVRAELAAVPVVGHERPIDHFEQPACRERADRLPGGGLVDAQRKGNIGRARQPPVALAAKTQQVDPGLEQRRG